MQRLFNGPVLTVPQSWTFLSPRTQGMSPSTLIPLSQSCILSLIMNISSFVCVSYEPRFHRILLTTVLFLCRQALSPSSMLPNLRSLCSLHSTFKIQSRRAIVCIGNLKLFPLSPQLLHPTINYRGYIVISAFFLAEYTDTTRDCYHLKDLQPSGLCFIVVNWIFWMVRDAMSSQRQGS